MPAGCAAQMQAVQHRSAQLLGSKACAPAPRDSARQLPAACQLPTAVRWFPEHSLLHRAMLVGQRLRTRFSGAIRTLSRSMRKCPLGTAETLRMIRISISTFGLGSPRCRRVLDLYMASPWRSHAGLLSTTFRLDDDKLTAL